MVLLIDTNVLIDFLAKRDEFYSDAYKVMEYCTRSDVQGYMAFHSIPNIWYVLRRKPDNVRRSMLKYLCSILDIAGADREKVIQALDETDFKDFEDCLQSKCASTVCADFIITRNVKDFIQSDVTAIEPADFCRRFLNTSE